MTPKSSPLRTTEPALDQERRPALLYMVKQLELVVRSRLDEILKPAGITALQYTALTVLDRHDGLSAAELARSSFVTPQSMADMMGNLDRRGFIRRERNPDNRRELVVRLTRQGRQLLATYSDEVRDLEYAMTASLTRKDREQFRSHLNVCRKSLSEPPPSLEVADRTA
jgi:DNA-binding MarR family transcriptional regulator